MARPISDEELQLKKRARRRLVGAIVLVTAVAVVLPMVLDSEPRPVSQNVEIQIPSPDSGELKPKAVAVAPKAADTSPLKGMPPAPKTDKSAAKVDGGAAAKPAAPSAVIADPADTEASRSVAETKAAPAGKEASTTASKADKDANGSTGAYVVQVAALADSSRVKQLQKQMAGAGVKTYTEVVTTKAGEVTRVRAGPYATREAAESARDQLKKAGLDGKVVPK